MRLAKPSQFMAAERTIIEDAWPGDVIGLFDPGIFRIGDTLCTGEPVAFEGVPRFSPEHFAVVRFKDPMKRKQMEKGLEQLSEEGTSPDLPAAQHGHEGPHRGRGGRAAVRGAPVPAASTSTASRSTLDRLPYELARWVVGEGYQPRRFWGTDNLAVTDRDGRNVLLFRNEWSMRYVVEQNPGLTFQATARPS